ncbi:MAG: helix-turn-helix transcriptional regulator [Actinomycetota bacterium]
MTNALGKALRRAREERGLSLRDASRRSAGRFTPSGIAGYERGERRISVERLVALSEVYGVLPQRILADTLREPGELIEVDRGALEDLPKDVRHLIASFIDEVLAMRAASDADRISIRSGDLEILAGDAGRSVTELARQVREALNADSDQTIP